MKEKSLKTKSIFEEEFKVSEKEHKEWERFTLFYWSTILIGSIAIIIYFFAFGRFWSFINNPNNKFYNKT